MSQELISIFDFKGIEKLRAELRLEPGMVRKVRTRFLKHFKGASAALEEIPTQYREAFASRVAFHTLSLDKRFDSEIDGATKLIFRTQQGYVVESVILRAGTGRTTLCVSSQVGCAAACSFCATGHMGVAISLTAPEILDQLVQANEILREENRTIRNLVFMGMGEPFHNESNLYETIDTLIHPEGFHHPASRILVSTVGIPDAMVRFARRFPGTNLALSLHSAISATRKKLIPLAERYSLDALKTALKQVQFIQNRQMMIEYLMLEGVNDDHTHAEALIEFVEEMNVHLNLIPYNPIEDAPELKGSGREVRDEFAATLKAAGLETTIRYSLGADIAAACGQLVRKENRAIAIERKSHL